MFGVWASQRQLQSRGDVSHVRLCARQTPIRKEWGGGGGVGGVGGVVGWGGGEVGVLQHSWSKAKN